MLKSFAQADAETKNASNFFTRIQNYIKSVESALPSDEEIVVQIITPSGGIVVNSLGYLNPDLFLAQYQDASENETTLLLHLSAVVLQVSKRKKSADKTRVPFGFAAGEEA